MKRKYGELACFGIIVFRPAHLPTRLATSIAISRDCS